ncbi:MAG: methyltransferase domain-containing protein [Candidatus Diapherotrites archaeon]|nr:methyltransferase domain-containing protein [Candidatus Diapherotrites archaeon]
MVSPAGKTERSFFSSRKEMAAFNEKRFSDDCDECWAFGWDWKTQEKVHQILKLLQPKPGERVLDLGCGGGVYAGKVFEASKAMIFGSDIAWSATRIAKTNHSSELNWINAFGDQLPFRNESFDKVYAIEVFEHLAEPEKVIAEIARIVKKGGRALLSNPVYPALPAPWYQVEDPQVHGHINFMSVAQYRREFEKHGMHVIGVRGYGTMQSLVEAHGKAIHFFTSFFRGKKNTAKKKSPSNSPVPSDLGPASPAAPTELKQSFPKKAINAYYRALYKLDFSLLGGLPMQDSAFMVFEKSK